MKGASGVVQRMQIAVTGMGSVTPFGEGVDRFWASLLAGQSAVFNMKDEFLAQYAPVAAQVDLNLEEYLTKKQIRNTDRFTQLALLAAQEALSDAGLIDSDGEFIQAQLERDDVAVALGSALGGVQSLEQAAADLARDASSRVSPRLISKTIPNAAAAAIAKTYGFRGPVMTYATACASASNAIGEGRYWLMDGTAKVVLAGGAEHLFTPAVLAGLKAAGALALRGPEDKTRWSRPFDEQRQGMVMGEGAAFLVLEPLLQAQQRGAKIYGLLSGYGSSNDAYHETAPHPEGAGALLAMERALKSAGLKPADVDYINAHATATPAGDAAEASALRQLFGPDVDKVPVSSIKGSVGHMLGTAGAIESIACLKSLETGWLPPTLNCETPDRGMPGNIVTEARQENLSHVLNNSFGFGGQNGVLVFSRPE